MGPTGRGGRRVGADGAVKPPESRVRYRGDLQANELPSEQLQQKEGLAREGIERFGQPGSKGPSVLEKGEDGP